MMECAENRISGYLSSKKKSISRKRRRQSSHLFIFLPPCEGGFHVPPPHRRPIRPKPVIHSQTIFEDKVKRYGCNKNVSFLSENDVRRPCNKNVSFLNEDGVCRQGKAKRQPPKQGRFPKTSCQVIYSQFGLAIHQNDQQARRRFVEWAQNEIAVVPDFHKRIFFSDEAHFWLNGYVNKQNCRIWSEANPQVYVETPLHPEKLTVWCALWAGGILLQKR
ncbi:uncharacterized protein TNCV_2852531 [Trichonephila clavipes]|uniref:Transposase n=1 Tax=Trichonephila clavipes TaxID=2585209 RepID=A0A8X6UZ63_TRICX|nr:uncharacterized protein TNCV_2852531 [Trichonephila clavipes]